MTLTKKIIAVSVSTAAIAAAFLPLFASALTMPQTGNELAQMFDINAQSYVVMDVQTGKLLIDQNANAQFTPASLTKLITALVVLDTKPNLKKVVAITQADQTIGACNHGGACIKAIPGIKFTVDGLFHAALLPSANNAANALSRSTGLTPKAFLAKMNAKAKALGATNTHFNDPTGMDGTNVSTAADYAKIVAVAFSNTYLKSIDQLSSFVLSPTNSKKYVQTIKNTDKLLGNADLEIIGAKTGYLDYYNFATLLKYKGGPPLAIVVMDEPHLYSAFNETAELASLAKLAQVLSVATTAAGSVLGASTGSAAN